MMRNYKDKILARLKTLPFIHTASSAAEEMNLELYIVGGFVRDIILDRERAEIDFLIIGDGTEFARKFADTLGVENISNL